jgi:hypothetical protein
MAERNGAYGSTAAVTTPEKRGGMRENYQKTYRFFLFF